jgi:hypothetical protein
MIEQEEDTPIFVRQLSFPGLLTVIHFEARYILYLSWTESANPGVGIASCFGAVSVNPI